MSYHVKRCEIFTCLHHFDIFNVFYLMFDRFGVFWAVFSVLGAPGGSGGNFLAPEPPPERGGFLIRLNINNLALSMNIPKY